MRKITQVIPPKKLLRTAIDSFYNSQAQKVTPVDSEILVITGKKPILNRVKTFLKSYPGINSVELVEKPVKVKEEKSTDTTSDKKKKKSKKKDKE